MSNQVNNLTEVKRSILCHGLRIDDAIREDILNINPYFFEKSFSHSSSIVLGRNILVNVPILDRFSKKSPYLLIKKCEKFMLIRDKEYICNCDVLKAPKWYQEEVALGVKAADVLREHDTNVLSCNPFRECIYFKRELKCRFCSYGNVGDRELELSADIELFVKSISLAFAYNPDYEINFSIGTWPGPDRGALKVIDLINRLRKKVYPKYISLEMAPPNDRTYLIKLKEVGISSIMFNLEFYDAKIREIMCPGKSKIGFEQYIKMWKEAVNIFGEWRVGSVLIAGIEPANSTIKGAEMLTRLGVLPIIMPFKPLDESMLSDASICLSDEMAFIQHQVRRIISGKLEIQKVLKGRGLGCLSCPGCSVQ